MPEEKDDVANAGDEEDAGEEKDEVLDDKDYVPETRKSVG